MKIFRYPSNFTDEQKVELSKELSKVAEEGERWIIIPDDIDVTDLSLDGLYELKKEIEKAIYDKRIKMLYDEGKEL